MPRIRTKINEVDKCFITNNPNMSDADLAKTLSLSEVAVKKFREGLPVAEKPVDTIVKQAGAVTVTNATKQPAGIGNLREKDYIHRPKSAAK